MNSRNYFRPKKRSCDPNKEGLSVKGFVDICVYEKGTLIDRICNPNIILNLGKAEVINSLTSGTNRVLARMAVGDRGTLPSDPTVPKTPDATRTSLYAETYRQDVDTSGTTTVGSTNEVLLTSTFDAVDIPLSAYSDQTNPVVNEIGLIMVDLISGNPLPRTPVAAPTASDADEALFAMRTFKTVPFESANETSVTIRYTIFIG